MFILYALPIGLVIGFATGGRAAGLSEVRLRWAPLAVLGLLMQLVLFFGPVAESVGALGMPVYIGSTALVLLVVLRNAARPGLAVVALGALSNLVAIVVNGGFMPASPAAMAALGRSVNGGYSNSAIVADPMLWPLTDIFAIPHEVPFANVFSVGDVLIGLGLAWAIAAAMHMRPTGDGPKGDAARGGVVERLQRQIGATPTPSLASAGISAATAAVGPIPRAASGGPSVRRGEPGARAPGVARLSRVDVTEAWADDLALTRWIADNVDLVGEAAGLELLDGQVLESERPVVLAEREGQSVVIVAERGPATDDAFGCLVRHVAACQAELGIWICGEAVDQHAASVAWLNVATEVRFCMLNLSAVRIGDSAIGALLSLAIRGPRADDPRYSMDENGRVAGAGRRARDWLRRS